MTQYILLALSKIAIENYVLGKIDIEDLTKQILNYFYKKKCLFILFIYYLEVHRFKKNRLIFKSSTGLVYAHLYMSM